MIGSIAWKNVWRNRKRSLIVIVAVLLGTVAGVFTAGLMKGWIAQRLHSVIHTEMAHIRINHPDYLLNEELVFGIPEPENLTRFLREDPRIEGFSGRTRVTAMAATARANTGIILNGIHPEEEKTVRNVHTKLIGNEGTYFDTPMQNPIVISDKTAEILRIKNYEITPEVIDSFRKAGVPEETCEKLSILLNQRFSTEKAFVKVLRQNLAHHEIKNFGSTLLAQSEHFRLRSRVVFTFTDSQGKLVYQTYKVCGVYKTNNTMFDQMNAFVLKEDLAEGAGFGPTDMHEIAVIAKEDTDVDALRNDMRALFPALSILSWKDLSPEAAMMTEFMDLWYLVIMGFILFALAFGIINTMLMAILERIKELGMLMAIGMNRRRVFRMIMLETVFLTLTGAVAGMGVGAIIIALTGKTGLNFSSVSEGFEAMGWSAHIFPEIDAGFFVMVTLLVILTGILSSIVPARKALSLNPVEAIRSE